MSKEETREKKRIASIPIRFSAAPALFFLSLSLHNFKVPPLNPSINVCDGVTETFFFLMLEDKK